MEDAAKAMQDAGDDLRGKGKTNDPTLYCVFATRKHQVKATQTLQLQGQGYFVVCNQCKSDLEAKHKDKRCQYCGVPIRGWKKAAISGFTHQVNCPRSELVTLEVG